MAASVNRFGPVVRGEGKIAPFLLPLANWIDAYLAPITTASSYTLPTGTDPSGGGSESANPSTPPGVSRTATILKITNPGPNIVWINAAAAATIPAGITSNGLQSVPIPVGTFLMFQLPIGVASISLIAATAAQIVSIESWW